MIFKDWLIIIEALRLLKQDKYEEKATIQIRVDELDRWIEEGSEDVKEYRRERDKDKEVIQKLSKEIVAINNIVAKIHCMNFS